MRDQQGIGMTSLRTRQRLVDRLIKNGIINSEILGLIKSIPRHLFIEEALSHRAYEDISLPIGYGQTISQPYIVAKMTELLFEKKVRSSILEIGTGSGYQTAVLASLCVSVYTTERIPQLQVRAKTLLSELGFTNINYNLADGGLGLESHAPYDGIISTCAPIEIPDSLLQSLSPDGGRLVIPVGGTEQSLTVVDRKDDEFVYQSIEPVIFVPLLPGISDS